jgi:2-polyprenyl-3-methyl-5-hydroxy-6-metoxy-1,4-benzoquinol methylase
MLTIQPQDRLNTDHKYQTFADAPGSTHNLVVDLVPPKSRVLEFGCATGYMSEVLASRLGCSVVGIELSPTAAEIARSHCERVVVGDAESLDLCDALGTDRFDVILFADVLEHLRDPAALLKRIGPFLAEGGSIIASIPNIAHGSVRLALLRGEFRYRELGLLDNTHIHFFTRESIQDTFEETGYLITHWVRQRLPIDETEIAVPQDEVLNAARSLIDRDHEATTYQFVVRAVPTTDELRQTKAMLSGKMRAAEELTAQLATEREAVEQQRRIIAQREDELATLKQQSAEQSRALEASTAALAAISRSTAWRISQRLSAGRRFLAPRNSVRDRVFLRFRHLVQSGR